MQEVTNNPTPADGTGTPSTDQQTPVTDAVQTTTTTESVQSAAPIVEVPGDEKLFSALSYIPLLSILFAPYAVSKHPKSAFVNLHAAQGLGIFVLWFISMVVLSLIPLLGGLVWLVLISLSVYGGINAWSGKSLELPFVKQLGDKVLGWLKGFLLSTGKTVVAGMTQAVDKPVETTPVQPTVDTTPEVAPTPTTENVNSTEVK